MRLQPTGGIRSILSLVLFLSCASALAGEPPGALRQPVLRNIFLAKNPEAEVPKVFVAAGVVTSLRFDTPCDPRQTQLLGWEGRFEPLVVNGKSVVLVPLQALAPDDRFLLVVTLASGATLPFTLVAAEDKVDGQVNVFPNQDSPEAVRVALEEHREENKTLRAENRRCRDEESSVDHALAALLASNQLALTPFKQIQKWMHGDETIAGEVTVLDSPGRAAVVFTLTNLSRKRPWKLREARLSSVATSEERPFALRMYPSSIAPGETGRIAIITDKASFASKEGADPLVFEIFRDGGLREGYVVVNMEPSARRRP
ncbi:DUF2381 family protein [Pyxidicoccus sp. 3LFB2]